MFERPLEGHMLGASGQPLFPDDLGAGLDKELSQVLTSAPRSLAPTSSRRTEEHAETTRHRRLTAAVLLIDHIDAIYVV
jgi:hypothetical protein